MVLTRTGVEIPERFIRRHSNQEEHGKSTLKRGPKPKILVCLTSALGTYVEVCHIVGEGEKRPKHLYDLLTVALSTKTVLFESNKGGVPDRRSATQRIMRDNADMMVPASGSAQEDRRYEWLTYKNLEMWSERWREFALEYGFATNMPELLSNGTYAEIHFRV